jgi:hypothetical protein
MTQARYQTDASFRKKSNRDINDRISVTLDESVNP